MFRLLLLPLIIGILAFLLVYFVTPEFISETEIVSIVAEFSLDLSNSVFDHMPPVVAKYIAGLDLALVSLTVALIAIVFIQILVISWSIIYYPIKWIISFMTKEKVRVVVKDLPAITPDSHFYRPSPGKKILGRGFDTVESD